MSNENGFIELFEIVQTSFNNAMKQPDAARWKSCAQLASVASCRIAAEGDLFMASALEGVSIEARRQMAEMMPQREEIAA